MFKNVLMTCGMYEYLGAVNAPLIPHKNYYLIDQFEDFDLYKCCESGISVKVSKRMSACDFHWVDNGKCMIRVDVDSWYYEHVLSHMCVVVEE